MKIELLSLIAKKMNVNGLKSALLVTALLMFGGVSWGQGTETFENIPANSSASTFRSWTGDNGLTWTATEARTDQTLDNRAITLDDDKANTYLLSGTISGGIGDLTVSTKRAFSGGSGTLNVEVNGSNVGTIPLGTSVQTTTITGINVSGNVTIKILNDIGGSNDGGAERAIIDNVIWTAYSAVSCSGEPTAQATGITISNETAISLDVSWSAGTGGDNYILVAREGSSVSWTPTDGTDYSGQTGSGDFSSATDQLNGNKVVYAGSGTSTTVTGLSASTTYYFQVFHLCSNDSDNYLTSTGTNNDGTQTGTTTAVSYDPSSGNMSYGTSVTLVNLNTINNSSGVKVNAYEDFTAQSTDLQIDNSYDLTVNLDTDGSYTIYARAWIDWNHDGDFNDINEAYDIGTTSNSSDGPTSLSPLSITVPSAATIGSTRMRVSGKYGSYADPNETGFDGEVEDYTINVIAPSTNDTDTEAYSGSQPAASNISSTSTAFTNVFEIEIEDMGTSDGLVTDVTNIRVKPHSTNTADWTDHIADVKLNNGSDITIGSPTITDTYIDIPISAGNLQIADGGSDVITLQVQINNTGITDNAVLSFMVDADDHDFTADASGSDFASEFMLGDFNSNDFTIDITGDELRFIQQPTDVAISTAISPSVTVAFTDENGNIDTDFTGSGCAIGLTTTGSFDASATTQVDAVNGVATFTNLVFDAEATDITLTTTDPDGWGWTNITSNQFDVTPVEYCTPAPSSGDGSGITNVTMGTIDNDSGQESGFYGDYSAQSTDVEQGSTVNCDITYETGFTYNTVIWVDWNNDEDFEDTGEEVYTGESTSSEPTTLNASFSVPAGASLGAHRLRIGGADSGPPTPCYTGTYAIFEDYTINVIAASPSLTASPTSLTGFTYEEGSGPSSNQTFTISGSNLVGSGNLTVTGSTNYEVSTDGSSYSASVTYPFASGVITSQPQTVYVRLKSGLSAATYNSETITVSGGGATDETVNCDGEVFPPTFTLSTSSLSGFTYEEGSGPSSEQSFDLSGSAMDGSDVTITPPANYEISLTSGSGFQNTAITLSSYDGSTTPVYVRLKAGLAVGMYNGEAINVAGGGASTVSVSCDGEVTPIIIDSEDFASCPPTGWIIYSVSSDEDWTCGSGYMEINNYNADNAANDWLISPPINLDNYTNEILTFETYKKYADNGITNPETKLYYSTDYSGSGNPSSSTWNSLTYNFPNDNSQVWTSSGDVDLSGITGSSVYIAFQHESSGTGGGSTSLWRMDNFEIAGTLATPCSSPANQPTALDLNDNTTYNSIDGSFTASTGSPAAHGYLVVRSESSTLSANPQDDSCLFREFYKLYSYKLKRINSILFLCFCLSEYSMLWWPRISNYLSINRK